MPVKQGTYSFRHSCDNAVTYSGCCGYECLGLSYYWVSSFPQEETVATSTLMLALGSPGIVFFGLFNSNQWNFTGSWRSQHAFKKRCYSFDLPFSHHNPFIDVYTFRTLCFDDSQLFIWFTSMLLNQRMLRKITRYRQEIKKTYYYLLFLLSSWVSL